jgi:hypothetical protein
VRPFRHQSLRLNGGPETTKLYDAVAEKTLRCVVGPHVVKIGRRFLDVESLDDELAEAVAPEFGMDRKNRRFVRPRLPSNARFGGCDERTVNAGRASGQELRLLPFHYATYTNDTIRERHAEDAARWPLPTGIVYERWFKDVGGRERRTNG